MPSRRVGRCTHYPGFWNRRWGFLSESWQIKPGLRVLWLAVYVLVAWNRDLWAMELITAVFESNNYTCSNVVVIFLSSSLSLTFSFQLTTICNPAMYWVFVHSLFHLSGSLNSKRWGIKGWSLLLLFSGLQAMTESPQIDKLCSVSETLDMNEILYMVVCEVGQESHWLLEINQRKRYQKDNTKLREWYFRSKDMTVIQEECNQQMRAQGVCFLTFHLQVISKL